MIPSYRYSLYSIVKCLLCCCCLSHWGRNIFSYSTIILLSSFCKPRIFPFLNLYLCCQNFFFLNLHFVCCFYHWHLTYCPHRLCHCLRSIVESDLAKSDNALFSELPVNNSVAFLKVRNTSVSYQSDSQWPVGWGLTFS